MRTQTDILILIFNGVAWPVIIGHPELILWEAAIGFTLLIVTLFWIGIFHSEAFKEYPK